MKKQSERPTANVASGLKIGSKIEILEPEYCGIVFARVGDRATITHLGLIPSGFWVEFDHKPETPCMVLTEHAGISWFVLEQEVA